MSYSEKRVEEAVERLRSAMSEEASKHSLAEWISIMAEIADDAQAHLDAARADHAYLQAQEDEVR